MTPFAVTSVEVPERMKHLPLDRRGYPIPVIVMRDENGLPYFAVNNDIERLKCVKRKLCAICGGRLTKELWLVGGPSSAFDPHGAYIDSALHHECMTYALQVCPYLAMPGRMMMSKHSINKIEKKLGDMLIVDPTIDPTKPKCFVAVMSYGQTITSETHIVPLRPYHAVEFWTDGQRLSMACGLALITKIPNLETTAALRLLIGRP